MSRMSVPMTRVKQCGQLLGERFDPAEGMGRFEASERLASGRGRRLITRLAIATARVSALRNIERNRNERAFELIAKRAGPSAQHGQIRRESSNELEHNGIDSKCHEVLLLPR